MAYVFMCGGIYLVWAMNYIAVRIGKTVVLVKDDSLDVYFSPLLLKCLVQGYRQVIESRDSGMWEA